MSLSSAMVVSTGNLILILDAYSLPVHHSTEQGCEEFSTAAVERGPSEGARSGSKESSSHPCAPVFKMDLAPRTRGL